MHYMHYMLYDILKTYILKKVYL